MTRLILAILAFLAFTGYSVAVAVEHDLLGFLASHQQGGWHLQVFVDLVVATLGFWLLGLPDAKRRGITAWPYALAAPLTGSIALLAYLVHREWKALREPELAQTPTRTSSAPAARWA